MSVAQMGVSLFAANEGYLKNVEVKKVLDFEAALHSYMASEHAELMKQVNESGAWDKDMMAKFKAALDSFVATQAW